MSNAVSKLFNCLYNLDISTKQDDPSTVSLSWILKEVTTEVDKNPKGRFLVDMMPNLKYIIRTANFSQDCSSSMAAFEEKV